MVAELSPCERKVWIIHLAPSLVALMEQPTISVAVENVTLVAATSLSVMRVLAGPATAMFWSSLAKNSNQRPTLSASAVGRVKVTAPEAPSVVNRVPHSLSRQV